MNEYLKNGLNEIRNRIANIDGVVSVLKISAENPDYALTRHLDRINSSVNRSRFIIDNLYHLAMLDESDFFTDDPEEVKSNTIARLNEIREPLSVINSSAFLLKSNFNGNDGKMARHIDGIQSNVNQIVTILDKACGPVFLEGWKL